MLGAIGSLVQGLKIVIIFFFSLKITCRHLLICFEFARECHDTATPPIFGDNMCKLHMSSCQNLNNEPY